MPAKIGLGLRAVCFIFWDSASGPRGLLGDLPFLPNNEQGPLTDQVDDVVNLIHAPRERLKAKANGRDLSTALHEAARNELTHARSSLGSAKEGFVMGVSLSMQCDAAM